MDAVFKALADPSRRKLLDKLLERDALTLGEMAEGLGMSRFGVMKHLRVLESCDLITTRRQGRVKLHSLNPEPILEIRDAWINRFTTPLAA